MNRHIKLAALTWLMSQAKNAHMPKQISGEGRPFLINFINSGLEDAAPAQEMPVIKHSKIEGEYHGTN